MRFERLTLDECPAASEAVVVIDVCRAFTTAAYALAGGASKIILAETTQQAFNWRNQNPDWLLVGEEDGLPIPGFDHWNSPFEVSKLNFSDKTLVLRTSSGTQGVVRCQNAILLLAGSFVVAQATADFLKKSAPASVSFVLTGVKPDRSGVEDIACADYIQALIERSDCSPEAYLQQAQQWDPGKISSDPEVLDHLSKDLRLCLQANFFHFPLQVRVQAGIPFLEANPAEFLDDMG